MIDVQYITQKKCPNGAQSLTQGIVLCLPDLTMKLVHQIACAVLGMLLPALSQAQSYTLWYTKPAEKWTDALPVGNGRIGGMVFGGVTRDRIQFNEETLWTGEPRDPNHKGAVAYLSQIRQLLADGKQKEADALAEAHFMGLKSKDGNREQWTADMLAGKGIPGNPASPDYDDSGWKTMPVPAYDGWESVGLDGLDGAVWLRTTVTIPDGWQDKPVVLDLNRIRDYDRTFINGKLVGTSQTQDPRKYIIPAGVLVEGKNVLAIQVLNYFDKGGVAGYKDTSRPIALYPQGKTAADGVALNGNWKYAIQNDEPPVVGKYQADYQPFGDLYLRFPRLTNATGYRRELLLSEAVSRTRFTANGIQYTREYFVSQPDQVLVVRLTADKPGSLQFSATLGSPHKKTSVRRIDDRTLALAVQVRNGALRGESFLRVETQRGSATVSGDSLVVKGADAVTLYLSAATNYVSYQDVSGNPVSLCQRALAGLSGKSFAQIRQRHVQEYQPYYNTFSVQLGSPSAPADNLPTDERLARFGKTNDPSFMALYMQYGRYLLISSSRPGTRPANLQGIWNDLLAPPWGSKYTTNINIEMNYWPAEVLNLSPLHDPLFGMIKDLSVAGRETAREHYGARGWVLHHNTDLWRGTVPINAANHGIWVTGAGWMSTHLWEHYRFTQDKTFLQQTAYPVMKEASRFFVDFLVKDPKTGWLISTPSNSPENGGLVAGPTMDHQIIRTLFRYTMAAGEALNTDAAFRDTLRTKIAQLAPNQIGRFGQLQEWLEDKDDTANKHRHVSHLWGVHPGNDITWETTPDLMKAARQSLIYRGDEGTGWSLAWKINFWARFRDGEHAQQMVRLLLRPVSGAGGSYLNLFDAHPPFQIDGNFGGAAGMAEMLIQSQNNTIDLLPALPSALSEGRVNGIRARGGFSLDYAWKNGQVTSLTVTSLAGQPCTLRVNGKEVKLATQKGKTYRVL